MNNNRLDGVYSFVERAYVRKQASDLLIRCMEDISVAPIQLLVESFLLDGPFNLNALNETYAEAARRRQQVQEDIRQLLNGLENSLGSYGLNLGEQSQDLIDNEYSQSVMDALLAQQGIQDMDTQTTCRRILHETRDIFENMSVRLKLLEDIENYLQDWLWGITAQSLRGDSKTH